MDREPYTGIETGNGADEGRVPGDGKRIIGPCEITGIEAMASL